jgi:hypothetical protein
MDKGRFSSEFETLKQIQDFWDTHSTADYWDEMEDSEIELSPALKSKIELRKLYQLLDLSSEEIEKIEKEAHRKNIDSKKLIHDFISEHI